MIAANHLAMFWIKGIILVSISLLLKSGNTAKSHDCIQLQDTGLFLIRRLFIPEQEQLQIFPHVPLEGGYITPIGHKL